MTVGIDYILANHGIGTGNEKTGGRLESRNDQVVTSGSTSVVTVPVALGFDPTSDLMLVFKDTAYVAEGTDYTLAGDGSTITTIGGDWTDGTVLDFLVITNTKTNLLTYDGALVGDGTLAETKLSQAIRDRLDASAEFGTVLGRVGEVEIQLAELHTFAANAQLQISEWENAPVDVTLTSEQEDALVVKMMEHGSELFLRSFANFAGKLKGDRDSNPHAAYETIDTSPPDPDEINSSGYELYQSDYDKIKEADGDAALTSLQFMSNYSYHMFEFDLLAHVTDEIGAVPGVTVADQAAWLRDKVAKIQLDWLGRGSGEFGKKATLGAWEDAAGVWQMGTGPWGSTAEHTSSSIDSLQLVVPELDVPSYIRDDGMFYAIAQGNIAGSTKPSSLYTDYVELHLELDATFIHALRLDKLEAKAAAHDRVTQVSGGETTLDARDGNTFLFANTAATDVSDFTDGVSGQELTILLDDTVTVIKHNPNIRLQGAVDYRPTNVMSSLRLLRVNDEWVEVARMEL